ncbi:MAG: TonB-dependent receptor plug domain-containing protein [Telluria sp.]
MYQAEPLRLTLLAAALSLSFSAWGQQAETPAAPGAPGGKTADDKVQKVEIRGSADAYNARRDDTASKIVIKNAEIVKYGDTNVLDVLKRLPGVTVGGSAVRMRGLGSGYTQFLVNGERPPIGFSLESLAPDSIESIEVMRAASAEYSTQSIAGTVNIILKKTARATLQREVKAGLVRGNRIGQSNLTLLASDTIGKFSYALTAFGMHNSFDRPAPSQEEMFDPDGRLVRVRSTSAHNHGDMKAINIGPRLNWTFANGDTLTSQTFVNANRSDLTVRREIATSLGAAPFFPDLNVKRLNNSDALRTDLNWVRRLGEGARLDVKAGANYSRVDNQAYRFSFTGTGAPGMDEFTNTDGDELGYTTTGKYSAPLGAGHALATGWDAGYSERREGRFERIAPSGGLPVLTDDDYLSRVSRFAVFGQDEWNVTKLWSVYLGVRWEGIHTTSSGNTFATATSRTSVLSPLFQTLYKLPGARGDQVRLAVTRTYKAPSPQSLIPRGFRSLENSPTEPDFLGNPDLRPELALGLDASYEHYWAPGALLSANFSAREIKDYTRNGLVRRQDGRWVVMPVNRGKAHTRSIELEAKFPLKAVMQDAPAIDLRANVARNWSSVDEVPGPYNRLDNQTPVSANVGIDYKNGALATGGSFNFSNGGLVRISAEQTRYQSVRRELEAYALWKFTPKVQLRVSAANILSQDGLVDATYADSRGLTRTVSLIPASASFRASLEVKF